MHQGIRSNNESNMTAQDRKFLSSEEKVARQKQEARTRMTKLKDGISEWIVANKQRTRSLELTAKTCDNVVDHSLQQYSRLRVSKADECHIMCVAFRSLSG